MARLLLKPTKEVGILKVDVTSIVLPKDLSKVVDTEICGVIVPKENIICAAFRDLELPLECLALFNVLFKDGNRSNLTPENLVPACYPERDEFYVVYKGTRYKRIPVLGGYGLSEDGKLLRFADNKNLTFSLDGRDYYHIRLDLGFNRSTLRLNRALGYTFIPYPANADDLVVDHKDNVKTNDVISNLQWLTQTDNIRKGRYVDNPLGSYFEALCLITNEVISANTLSELVNKIPGLHQSSVETLFDLRMANGKTPYTTPHHLVRVVKDNKSIGWPKVDYDEVLNTFGIYEVKYNNRVAYFGSANVVIAALRTSGKSFPLYLKPNYYPGLIIRKVLKTVYDEFVPYHIKPIPLPKLETGSSSKKTPLTSKRVKDGAVEYWDSVSDFTVNTGTNTSGVFKLLRGEVELLPGGYQVKHTDGNDVFPDISNEVLNDTNYKYVAVYRDGKLLKVVTSTRHVTVLFNERLHASSLTRLLRGNKVVKVGDYVFKNSYLPVDQTLEDIEIDIVR